MSTASNGKNISFHYTGTLKDGSTFDSSEGRDPLSFEMGSGQIIPGLEKEMEGMAVGDTKRIEVAADEAYGPYREEIIQAVERSAIPESIPLEVGLQLQAQDQAGNAMQLKVLEFDDASVRLDPNHPLAGEDLIFDVEIVGIA